MFRESKKHVDVCLWIAGEMWDEMNFELVKANNNKNNTLLLSTLEETVVGQLHCQQAQRQGVTVSIQGHLNMRNLNHPPRGSHTTALPRSTHWATEFDTDDDSMDVHRESST